MNGKFSASRIAWLLIIVMVGLAFSAKAQNYPSKPMRIVVGMAPGGSNDIVARLIGLKITEESQQPVVIDNRPGAGGTIAPTFVAKAGIDGHTILLISLSQVIAANLFDKLPYNLASDFEPVTQLTGAPLILVATPALKIKTVKDLIAAAKSKPGKLNYASAGEASSTHITMELFKSMTGTDMVHVPYKGQAPSLVDLAAGRVDVSFAGIVSALPFVRDGRFQALAVTGSKRFKVAPDVPTVIEAGVPGFEVVSWLGVLAPAKTPKNVVNQIHAGIARVLKLPDVQKKLTSDGADLVGSSPEEFGRFLRSEMEKWGKVIKQAKIGLAK